MFVGACSALWPKPGPPGSPLGGIGLGESSLAWSPCTGSWGTTASLAALQGRHFLPGAGRRGASRPQAPWPASVGNLQLYVDAAQAGQYLLGTGCGSPGCSSEAWGFFRRLASGRSAPGALLRASSQLLAWVPRVLAGVTGACARRLGALFSCTERGWGVGCCGPQIRGPQVSGGWSREPRITPFLGTVPKLPNPKLAVAGRVAVGIKALRTFPSLPPRKKLSLARFSQAAYCPQRGLCKQNLRAIGLSHLWPVGSPRELSCMVRSHAGTSNPHSGQLAQPYLLHLCSPASPWPPDGMGKGWIAP